MYEMKGFVLGEELTYQPYDVEAMKCAIHEFSELLDQNGVSHWLNFGALLGLVRENRLLPWDNDAEINCWEDSLDVDLFVKITDELNCRGYDAYYLSSIAAISIKKKGVEIAFSSYRRDGNRAVRPHEAHSEPGHGNKMAKTFYFLSMLLTLYRSRRPSQAHFRSYKSTIKLFAVHLVRLIPLFCRRRLYKHLQNLSAAFGGEYQMTAIPSTFYDATETVSFYGKPIMIPKSPELFLEYVYGKGWNIPKQDWHFHYDENKDETGIKFVEKKWDYDQIV
jgi:hypothetical protein